MIINNEIKFEEMRNEINKMYSIKMSEFFNSIDKTNLRYRHRFVYEREQHCFYTERGVPVIY